MMIVYNLPAHRPTAVLFPTVRPPGALPAREHPYRDIRMLLIISMTMTMIRSGTIRSQ